MGKAMAKIPKNLSDKDMFKDYHEEPTIEHIFLHKANEQEKHESINRNKNSKCTYLTEEILGALEKMLLELKLELYREGMIDYRMTVHRDGKNIVLTPVAK